MEFRELCYILTIAKYGKISAAASELYMAQSSLSQFLKSYEERLGFPLFIRTNKGLLLTQEGSIYVETAKQILGLRRNFFSKIADLNASLGGSVRFSVSTFRAPHLLPKIIPAFADAYPHIHLDIWEGNMKTQEEWLRQNMVDVGFVTIPMDDSSLPYRKLADEEILLAAHAGHPLCALAHRSGSTGRYWLDINDLNGQDFLLYSVKHRLREFAEDLFRRYKIAPRIVQSHNSFETLIRLAEAKMGVTFLPETYLEKEKELRYFSLGPDGCYRTLALGYPANGYCSHAAEQFSVFLLDYMKCQIKEVRKIRESAL